MDWKERKDVNCEEKEDEGYGRLYSGELAV